MEALAAADLLRTWVPDLRFRFVNVVDLMRLPPADAHPHGTSDEEFAALFTDDVDVVMAFHGYPNAVHGLLHGHANTDRFHVHGFREQGTTTTPFDMVVLNGMSRFHLAADAIRRASRRPAGASGLLDHCDDMLARHHDWTRSHFEDLPEIADWTWSG
jgi:xylulose-5-phosphate/fructose-6-phosphate phosphoketolase